MTAGVPQKSNDRAQTDEAVRRTEDLYRRAINGVDAVPYEYDFQTRSYLFMDERIQRLIGYSSHEVTPSFWGNIVQETVMTGETAGLDKDEAIRRMIQGEVRSWHCDVRVVTQDGASRWISDSSVPTFDDEGNLVGAVGILQDVSERKKAEGLLSAFSALGSRLGATRTVREAGQIIVDAADRLLGWDACLVYLYAPDTELLTQVLVMDSLDGKRTEFAPHSAHLMLWPLARKTIHEGGQLILKSNLEVMLPDAVPFGDAVRPSASILYVPIRNGTSVTGLLSIQSYTPNAYTPQNLETLQTLADHCGGALNRIWTEEALRKMQENLRQSQKLEAIGQLAGGIAHDFNNLLAVIRGNIGLVLMRARGLSGEDTDCLNQISAASDRAASLTRQLLAFSRKQTLQSQPVDLNSIINNLSKMLMRVIGEDFDLHWDYAPVLPPVQADSGMLEQVIINLVVNARDAMPEGGQLFITTEQVIFDARNDPAHPEARPGAYVCVTVRDTGAGIPPEILPRIFDPFFTTKAVGKGTGLGLATAYGIVKQHLGWIEVSSHVGAGTAFKVFLPALHVIHPAPQQPVPEAPPPGGLETILLVEDEACVREITRLLLEYSGYRVIEAGSGIEALKIWDANISGIDLLLTDVIMPEGITGLKLARELHARKGSLKIIFQSGYGGEIMGEIRAFVRQTNGWFLQKPCGPKEMLRVVRRALDGLPSDQEQ